MSLCKLLIALAYQVRQSEISGGPAGIVSDKYAVNGKAADSWKTDSANGIAGRRMSMAQRANSLSGIVGPR